MATYKSQYTGAQIDEAVGKATGLTANNGEETTADLSTLKVGDVNYKIPEGAVSEPIAMEGFLARDELVLSLSSINGRASVIINGNVSRPAFELPFPLIENEYLEPKITQNKYTFDLKQSAKDKLAKAVVLPDTTPDSPRIVSIAADGTQQNLTLGDGITVEDGVISASGGGGGSVSLYDHTLSMMVEFFDATFEANIILVFRTHILTNSPDEISSLTFEQCMEYFGTPFGSPVTGNNVIADTYDYYPIEFIRLSEPNNIFVAYYTLFVKDDGHSITSYVDTREGAISKITIMGDYVRQII